MVPTELCHIYQSLDPGILQLLQLLRGQPPHGHLTTLDALEISLLVWLMTGDGSGRGVRTEVFGETSGVGGSVFFVGFARGTARWLTDDTFGKVLAGSGRREHGVVVVVIGAFGGRGGVQLEGFFEHVGQVDCAGGHAVFAGTPLGGLHRASEPSLSGRGGAIESFISGTSMKEWRRVGETEARAI